jgi:hypothetical protein
MGLIKLSLTAEQEAVQAEFDLLAKNGPKPAAFKMTPDDPISILESWHKAIGTNKDVAAAEIKELKQRIAKQKGKG